MHTDDFCLRKRNGECAVVWETCLGGGGSHGRWTSLQTQPIELGFAFVYMLMLAEQMY